MGSLILLRHPETALNKKGHGESAERIRGWVNIDLDQKGMKEAAAIGTKYANSGVTRVYSSDLIRAERAAQSIAKGVQATGRAVPLIRAKELRPWNLGILHGKEVDKVLPVMNKCVEHPDVVIPDGESFDSYRGRYLPFLGRMLSEAAASSGPVIAVTHSRNIQLARAWDKAGRDGTNFDVKRMLNYEDEVQPGQHIELKP